MGGVAGDGDGAHPGGFEAPDAAQQSGQRVLAAGPALPFPVCDTLDALARAAIGWAQD